MSPTSRRKRKSASAGIAAGAERTRTAAPRAASGAMEYSALTTSPSLSPIAAASRLPEASPVLSPSYVAAQVASVPVRTLQPAQYVGAAPYPSLPPSGSVRPSLSARPACPGCAAGAPLLADGLARAVQDRNVQYKAVQLQPVYAPRVTVPVQTRVVQQPVTVEKPVYVEVPVDREVEKVLPPRCRRTRRGVRPLATRVRAHVRMCACAHARMSTATCLWWLRMWVGPRQHKQRE